MDENDLYLTSAETRATYKELQEYVFNTYGVKVSTLYISQVRNKYGLPTQKRLGTVQHETSEDHSDEGRTVRRPY